MADTSDRQAAQIVDALRAVLCQIAEPTAVLASILQQAVDRTGADRGMFVEVRDDGVLEYRVLNGFQARHFEGDAGAFSRSLFARVVETGESVMLKHAAHDPLYGTIGSVQALRTAAILCVPIRVGERIAALVYLENRQPGHFRAGHLELVRSLIDIAVPALEAVWAGREVIAERDRLRTAELQAREEAAENRALLAREWSFGRFVGRSKAVHDLADLIQQAADSMAPVLLFGEPGTGKSILARVIHNSGPRANRPFITVSCPLLEKGMVGAELFGHRKGVFTGAIMDREGKVHAAQGGTLFLDEIGDLPLDLQTKLLRLLEEQVYEVIGDTREQPADVRIIAATNQNLADMIEQGRFRPDLFDRLNYLPIRVPPLRERREDIPRLLRHFLDQTEAGRWMEVAADAERHLERLDHPWAGNVREIRQLAARLTAEKRTVPVTVEDVVRLLDTAGTRRSAAAAPEDRIDGPADTLPESMDRMERAWILKSIRSHPGLTRAELAERLGISESALYRKLRHHGIDA